jgi:hypothetical protein
MWKPVEIELLPTTAEMKKGLEEIRAAPEVNYDE